VALNNLLSLDRSLDVMSSQVSLMDYSSSTDLVEVNLLTFAVVRELLELAGFVPDSEDHSKYRVVLKASWTNARALRQFLCQELYPCLAEIESSIALALNMQYLDFNDGPLTLRAEDNLAFIPPISGG